MDLLDIKDLEVTFHTAAGDLTAVRGVSVSLRPGEVLGIIGESGSGKSVLCQTIMGLYDRRQVSLGKSRILFHGQDLTRMSERELCRIRGDRISMIFQDAMTALDPIEKIYRQLNEIYRLHRPEKSGKSRGELAALLGELNIPDPEVVLDKYPFELSGGMCQRIVIAMALLCRPEILIADEPTTALDVTTQAEILYLIKKAQRETGCAVIFITHDLDVIRQLADRVAVMYLGKLQECCGKEEFFARARHPYSQGLLRARPANFDGRFRAIPGNIPNPYETVTGCAYHTRCERATALCGREEPPLREWEGHMCRCHFCGEEDRER